MFWLILFNKKQMPLFFVKVSYTFNVQYKKFIKYSPFFLIISKEF